mgnify:CR=1 FL=1
MLTLEGFATKKEAKACQRLHGGKVCYERDNFGRSKNKDHYRVAVTVGHLDRNLHPYCVFYYE